MQVYSTGEAEAIAYTGRQLNSASTAIKFFNMAVLCELEQEPLVVEAMNKCFDFVEVAHGYNKSVKLSKSFIILLYIHIRLKWLIICIESLCAI